MSLFSQMKNLETNDLHLMVLESVLGVLNMHSYLTQPQSNYRINHDEHAPSPDNCFERATTEVIQIGSISHFVRISTRRIGINDNPYLEIDISYCLDKSPSFKIKVSNHKSTLLHLRNLNTELDSTITMMFYDLLF